MVTNFIDVVFFGINVNVTWMVWVWDVNVRRWLVAAVNSLIADVTGSSGISFIQQTYSGVFVYKTLNPHPGHVAHLAVAQLCSQVAIMAGNSETT